MQFSSKLEFSTVSRSPIVGSIVFGLVPLTEQWGAARNLGTGRTGFDQRGTVDEACCATIPKLPRGVHSPYKAHRDHFKAYP